MIKVNFTLFEIGGVISSEDKSKSTLIIIGICILAVLAYIASNLSNINKLVNSINFQQQKDVVKNEQKQNDAQLKKPSDIANFISPTVVYIKVFDENNRPFASGSGFIVDNSGKIVTNYHVISKANKIIRTISRKIHQL